MTSQYECIGDESNSADRKQIKLGTLALSYDNHQMFDIPQYFAEND